MKRRGLIERTDCADDARATVVAITDVGQHGHRAAGQERPVVVFTEGVDVEPGLFGVPGDADDGPEPFLLGRGTSGDDIGADVADAEQPELHGGRSCRRWSWWCGQPKARRKAVTATLPSATFITISVLAVPQAMAPVIGPIRVAPVSTTAMTAEAIPE